MKLFISILRRRLFITLPMLLIAFAVSAIVIQLTTSRALQTAGKHTITITKPATVSSSATSSQVLGDSTTVSGSASGVSGDVPVDSGDSSNAPAPAPANTPDPPTNTTVTTTCDCASYYRNPSSLVCPDTTCAPVNPSPISHCGTCGGGTRGLNGGRACPLYCLD